MNVFHRVGVMKTMESCPIKSLQMIYINRKNLGIDICLSIFFKGVFGMDLCLSTPRTNFYFPTFTLFFLIITKQQTFFFKKKVTL